MTNDDEEMALWEPDIIEKPVGRECDWFEMVRRGWVRKLPKWIRYNELFRVIFWREEYCREDASTLVETDVECGYNGWYCEFHGRRVFMVNRALREIVVVVVRPLGDGEIFTH